MADFEESSAEISKLESFKQRFNFLRVCLFDAYSQLQKQNRVTPAIQDQYDHLAIRFELSEDLLEPNFFEVLDDILGDLEKDVQKFADLNKK